MPTLEASAEEMRLVTAIGRLRKSMRARFEARAAERGEVTAPQFQVLRRLWEQDGLTTSALMRDVGSDGGTITGVLDRLEAKGLVRRVRDSEDRRAVRVLLTPTGRALEEPLMQVLGETAGEALAGFTERQRAEIVDALERMEQNLEVSAAGTSGKACRLN